MEPMEIYTEHEDGAAILRVTSGVDFASADKLATAIDAAASQSDEPIIVCLRESVWCDSSGLGVFLKAKRELGDRFAIVLPPEHPIRQVFSATQLTEHLSVYPTREDAIAASTAG